MFQGVLASQKNISTEKIKQHQLAIAEDVSKFQVAFKHFALDNPNTKQVQCMAQKCLVIVLYTTKHIDPAVCPCSMNVNMS